MNTDLRNDDPYVDRLTAYLDQHAGRTSPGAPTADAQATGPDATGAQATGSDVAGADLAEAEMAEFAALADELRAPAAWGAPPAGLRDAILSRVREQAAASVAAEPLAAAHRSPTAPEPQAAPQPQAAPVREVGAPARGSRWRDRWGRLSWAIPVAAVAAAAFTVGVVAIDRALLPGQPAGETYVATGTQLAPSATATVVVSANPSGFSLRVQATGLPAAAPGSYYSAWLHGPRGVVPLGSFHQHQQGSSVALWSGVDPADYTTMMITLQAEGQPPSPSDLVVMTATLQH